ncbi:MAG: DinB family protein [Dehalococcoidia bacterium]
MDAVTYAKTDLETAFGLFNTCAGGMDEAQYNWKPEGTCNSIAKSHVHALSSIDFFVITLIKGGQPSWAQVAQANGLPASPLEVWNYDGQISMDAIMDYGKNVQKAALDHVATMKDADLDREIETQFFGTKTAAWLMQLAGVHSVGHGGDIAAVKGMQGLKGLPF